MTELYLMKCPYCLHIFTLTQTQINVNEYFKCPNCKQLNCESVKADEEGILLGIRRPMGRRYGKE